MWGNNSLQDTRYNDFSFFRWIKDCAPCFISSQHDFVDRKKFPAVDYMHLMKVLFSLLQNLYNEQDKELNETVLRTIACIVPFVEKETFFNLLVMLSDALYDVQPFFHLKIVDLLTQYLIPFAYSFMTPDKMDDMADINLLIPSLLSNVLDATLEPGSWTKMMECIMRFKINASTDLLMVLAYGTNNSLKSSLHLLNRYFPPVDIGKLKILQNVCYSD